MTCTWCVAMTQGVTPGSVSDRDKLLPTAPNSSWTRSTLSVRCPSLGTPPVSISTCDSECFSVVVFTSFSKARILIEQCIANSSISKQNWKFKVTFNWKRSFTDDSMLRALRWTEQCAYSFTTSIISRLYKILVRHPQFWECHFLPLSVRPVAPVILGLFEMFALFLPPAN